jgi:hypothetical protein
LDETNYLEDLENEITEGLSLVENDLRIWWGDGEQTVEAVLEETEEKSEKTEVEEKSEVEEETEEEESESMWDPIEDCTETNTPPYFEVFHEKMDWFDAEAFCIE